MELDDKINELNNKVLEAQRNQNEQLTEDNKLVQPRQNGEVVEANNVSFDDLQNKFLRKQVDDGKTLSEIATDFAKARVTSDIINDKSEEGKKFIKDLAEEQKDTIKEGFKGDKTKAQTKTLEAKKNKAEAFYNGVRPILEFDFSNLIHKKDSKDNKVEVKTYSDRSYGIPLMCGMLLFLTVPYFVISIILALFNGVNAILEEVNTFGKIAKYIVLSVLIIISAILIIYCGICGVEKLFSIHIIH